MSGDTLEVKFHQCIGIVAAAADCVLVARMVGQAAIQVVEDAGSCHIGLTGQVLLCRTGIEAQGTGEIFLLHGIHQSGECQYTGCTQQVMTAGVTVSTRLQRVLNSQAGLLAQTGQSIELTQNTDDRLAAAILSDESSFNHIHR